MVEIGFQMSHSGGSVGPTFLKNFTFSQRFTARNGLIQMIKMAVQQILLLNYDIFKWNLSCHLNYSSKIYNLDVEAGICFSEKDEDVIPVAKLGRR